MRGHSGTAVLQTPLMDPRHRQAMSTQGWGLCQQPSCRPGLWLSHPASPLHLTTLSLTRGPRVVPAS